ncbi:MAG: prepilin-type N-terminal cleavage/methylation domain-containing protein [Proteobacteria bacterium]|nr:prepilin-type N-terminal cleavage/methylation domain-containing protein [Pseudomonadota bacterium]
MKKTFSSKKSAFSLIELSIVLIIIGLLIAGVTGGASLIKSSELRAAISEARGWSTAVNGFYNQFNAFPGDYINPLGGQNGGVGNGNSQINAYTVLANPGGDASAAANCVTAGVAGSVTGTFRGCMYEDNVAWHQLRSAGVLDTNTVSDPSTGPFNATTTWSVADNATFGTTNPGSKIKSSGWVFDYNTTSLQNVVILTGAITTAPATVSAYADGTRTTGAIAPADALSIDTKVDDGVANTGRVQAVEPSGNTCFTTTRYDTGTTTKTCALAYQVDLNS